MSVLVSASDEKKTSLSALLSVLLPDAALSASEACFSSETAVTKSDSPAYFIDTKKIDPAKMK